MPSLHHVLTLKVVMSYSESVFAVQSCCVGESRLSIFFLPMLKYKPLRLWYCGLQDEVAIPGPTPSDPSSEAQLGSNHAAQTKYAHMCYIEQYRVRISR